ncbi:hypothetical protein E3N88_29884 [Mikania micrantha]|uniref:E3 ubiquitin-protein ligase n=1 Tax=Mikania micrantha TaxID=192012 RepID=A0A5N6MK06_9ASTR|nr:hypothetical protein E3N88_29884 [Mikania micrantha]
MPWCLRAIGNWLKSGNACIGFGVHQCDTISAVFGDRDYTNIQALGLADWPEIDYDVGSQQISVHIPLHRLLSLVLQRALVRCYGDSESSACSPTPTEGGDFFRHVLVGCHLSGFSAFVTVHPLGIRVFCSEVCAGMWGSNADDAILSYECYRLSHRIWKLFNSTVLCCISSSRSVYCSNHKTISSIELPFFASGNRK